MRNLNYLDAERVRSDAVRLWYGGWGDHENGVFEVPSPIDGQLLHVIASSGEGWEHVSVSRPKRPPNWAEMCRVKELFFEDDETVVQYHVPPEDHVNCHPYCLHLWRPLDAELPRPPSIMVGPDSAKGARP